MCAALIVDEWVIFQIGTALSLKYWFVDIAAIVIIRLYWHNQITIEETSA